MTTKKTNKVQKRIRYGLGLLKLEECLRAVEKRALEAYSARTGHLRGKS